MRERLKTVPCKEFIKYQIKPSIDVDSKLYLDSMLDVSLAHLIMLVDQQIISVPTAKMIVEAINKIKINGPDILQIDPKLEDLYFNIEAFIINEVGIKVGGQLHTARSRNDLVATLTRITSRNYILQIAASLMELRYAILNLAENNVEVVMPGYTHLQPAEPITFAHYLSAILHVLDRGFKRLQNAYERMNQCPLGAGALATTSFAIDRERTSKLLGFDKIIENSLDAVASRDYVLEILSSLHILINELSRFSQDLYFWSSYDISLIEIDDSVAICSSIMPQKKNPVILEHIKSKAAHIQGAYVSASSSMKNTQYSHCRDISSECLKYYWTSLEDVEATLKLLTVTVNTLKVNKEKMYEHVTRDFSTVTELVNILVRQEAISFREAHSLVAEIVVMAIEKDISADQIPQEMLELVFFKVVGRHINLPIESFKSALDPLLNVQSKKVLAGPSSKSVLKQLTDQKEHMSIDANWLIERKEALNTSNNLLQQNIHDLLSKIDN